jgi:hypothetical protein
MQYKIGKLKKTCQRSVCFYYLEIKKIKKSVHPKKNIIFRCTQIKMYSWDNAQVVLVGNKCDLEQDRAVTHERGKRLADQMGKCLNVVFLDVRACCFGGDFFALYKCCVVCYVFLQGFYR